jgi:membrane protein DedA with SNARE-associated domain
MNEALAFVMRHGYSVLFVWVFAEQIGLPIPAIPILLAAGALAGAGHMNLGLALLLGVLASLISDVIWYEIGRRRGAKVLNLLCRISLEPDSCVRRTEGIFAKHGARSLLVAKFVPGLNTVAPPLAGIFQMRLSRFLLFDTGGALIWVSLFIGLGWLFSDQIELLAQQAARFGGGLMAVLLGGLGLYIAWKYWQRQRFLRSLRVARITADELKKMIDAGESPVIVDLRHGVDFEADPEIIPGAAHLATEDLEQVHDAIPRDRDIILYCT